MAEMTYFTSELILGHERVVNPCLQETTYFNNNNNETWTITIPSPPVSYLLAFIYLLKFIYFLIPSFKSTQSRIPPQPEELKVLTC